MTAIPYPDPATTPGLAEVYEEIGGLGRRVLNLYRVMGHSPEGLRAYLGLSHFVRDKSSLAPALRELVTLQTGVTLGAEYEIAHHTIVARQVGVSEDKIQAVLAGKTEGFEPVERAALAYAREVGESRSASVETLAALRQHLSLRQISDLVITVGMYTMCAAILMPLQVEIDA